MVIMSIGNRPKRPIAKTAPMKVENGPRKPKRPRPKWPQWKKKQDQNGPSQHPKRPILMSKTAHYVTLYKYRINDVIKCTWGIPYKRVDAAAVVAAPLNQLVHLNVRRAWETYSAIRCWGVAFTTWKDADHAASTFPPCILETIIAFILVLITCVYV